LFLLVLFALRSNGANRYSVANGNWGATGTWSATSGGASGASVPVAGDNVYIEGGRTVTVNTNAACANISVASGSTFNIGAYNFTASNSTLVVGTLNITSGTGNKSMGAISISGGTWNTTGNETVDATSLTFSGSTISGTRTTTFNVSGNMTVTAATTNTFAPVGFTIAGTTTIYGTVIVNSTTGNKYFNGGLTVSGGTITSNQREDYYTTNLTLSDATLDGSNFGRYTATGNLTIPTGTSTIINPAQLTITGTTTIDGTLNVNSTAGGKIFIGRVTISSTGNWNNTVNEAYVLRGGLTNNGAFTAGTAAYTFNTNSQSIDGNNPVVFGGGVTITGAITITNNTTVTISGRLNGSVAGSTWTNSANTTLNAGNSVLTTGTLNASATGNTVNYFRAGNQTIKPTTYHHLSLAGTGTKTLTGLTTVNGNLTTSSTGTLTATTAAALTIGGNLDIGTGSTFTVAGFNFTVNGTTTVSGIHPHSSATGTKTYHGDVTINLGGSWTNAGNEGFTFNGDFQNDGTLTAGTGATAIYNFAGSSKTLSGTSGIVIPYTRVNGSYSNQTTLTVATALTGTGTLTQADNVTLNIGGTSTITTLTATATGNTVNYTGVAQTVENTNYHNLIFSGSNIKTMPASGISIAGNFTTAGTAIATAGAGYTFWGDIILGTGTTFNAGNFTHSLSGDWSNNGATINPSTGTFIFNGGSSQTIGGTTNTTFNCFTVDNAAGIVLGRAVNAACVTLTNGLVPTTATNLLSITGTSPTAITGSASSYVNGPLARNLPATSGVTYSFPIGKSGYNPFELVNANTTGAATIQAEVFDANCGGTAGTGMSTLATNRYWGSSFVSGSGNFTNAQIRLTESGLDSEDAIGQSATSNGIYVKISTSPPSGSTITSDAITSLGYFVIGKRPAISIAASQDGTEGSTNGEFTLTTSYQFAVPRDISITIIGSATNGTDYTSITSPFSFPANTSTATLTVPVTDDSSVEPVETVTITINAGTGYSVGSPSEATIDINDDDVAGITVSPTSGLTTSEIGGQATFTIVLNTQPTADVTIGLSTSDNTEGTVSPSSVTFTNGNWNNTQTITITGANDFVDDGDIAYSIVTAAANSTDGNYNGLNASDVSVTNTDNDIAGVTVDPISGLTTTEAGGQTTFTIVLNSQPTADVTIGLSSDDTSEGDVSPTSVTFTDANWDDPQTITVTGVNDFIVDGNIGYSIVTATITSSDGNYNGLNPDDVSITNTDNDVAGFVVDPTSGLQTTEAGDEATFTIVLTSQPSNDVTISITSDDTSEGTVAPSSITFTNGNWNSTQTITITGVDGPMVDGDITYHIVTGIASSSDANYNGLNPDNVTVVNIDNDVAGISINPVSGLVTTEAGGTATFTIVLNTQPTNDVTIGLSSSDASEGTVSPTSVTFSNANWSSPQTVTLTGVNDDIDDGNIAYTAITAAATSSDAVYDGMNPSNVSATNIDNDIAGITVNPTLGLVTTEAGGTATFTIRLNSEPTADVTIGLSSSDTSEGTISPSSVTFTSGNWNATQTITITGVNDAVDDGNISYSVITAAATSFDGLYNGMNASNVSVSNTDDDTAGITVNPTSGLTTTEAGGQASFTVVLNSEPTANVVIDIVSSDPTEGTVSPSSITFTSGNWSSAQTITITGVNDFVIDGNVTFSIITTVEPTADVLYNAINPADVSVTNSDNDVAGITVNPTNGLTTTEVGGTATFTIKLDSEPSANVVIGISSSDITEGTVSPASLTFTSVNWSSTQTVTVTGVNDFIDDGDVAFTIVTAAAISTDGNYNGLNANDVSVTNTDNDVAGISVNPTSGLTTTETGGTAQFTLVLTSEPTANVTIGISSSDTGEGTVSTSSLTFTNGNWNVAQTVTISGVDDFSIDGNIGYTIFCAAAISADGGYNGMDPSDVSATNTDNDVAQVIVDPTSGLSTDEDGNSDLFTIELSSIPTSDVTINLSSSDLTEGTVSPSSITLNSSNWNNPQIVTVTGENDDIDDDDVIYTIITSASSSADGNYNNLNVADVSVTNIDNDDAGIIVDPLSGLVTSENLTSATFTIVLNTQPTANVRINLSVDDNSEGEVSPNSVTFTSGNWSAPQTVTVTGKNDNQNDGDIIYNVLTASAISGDAKYSGMDADDVEVTNLDNDSPGITVSPTSGLTTTEAGGTAYFTVVLITQPSDDVTIDLSSGDATEGSVSPTTLTFTNGNWNTSQTVTITGENDVLVDGDIGYSITLNPAISDDNDYDGIDPDDVSVTNTDLTPTITLGSDPTICAGSISANLSYSATTLSPNQYSIDFDGAAEAQGFTDVSNVALPSSPITISVPAGASAGAYNGTLTVRNSANGTCISPEYSITVTVISISVALSIEDGDDECPELDIAKGFNPDNNGPYNAGATEVIFRVTRLNSTAPTWEFDYEIQDATVHTTSPEDQTGTISGIVANYYDLHFHITNDPGNPIDVKLVVTEVSDSEGCSDTTNVEETINILPMPAVGPFE
jgi:hypothetical protein